MIDCARLQTERYAPDDFTYDLNLEEATDGDYVLVLRFSEVYFNGAGEKIFDVRLNHEHTILRDFDIHAEAGKAHALDVHVPFSLHGGRLTLDDEGSTVHASRLPVTFVRGRADNAKINALYVLRGTMADLPHAPTPVQVDEPVE